MPYLFKVISNTPSTPPTVGDTNFKEHYPDINRQMAWSEMETYIRQAAMKNLLPYVGPVLADLATKYDTTTVLSPAQQLTLELLQDSLAYYAIYHALPQKNVSINSMGVNQNTPTDGTAQPASQWSWKNARWAALENGDLFLDLALAQMERQVQADDDYYNLWKNSDAYTNEMSDFFRNTEDLDKYLNIKKSRRSFLSIIKYIKEVEEEVIKRELCTAQYQALVDGLKEGDLSTENKLLLQKVRKVAAYRGLYEAIPHHRIVIDGDGFRVVSQSDMFDDRRNQTNNVHESAIIALSEKVKNSADKYMKELKTFLNEFKDDYPLWRDSDCACTGTGNSHRIVVSPDGVGGIGVF
jgi:hypothetical protein